MEKENILWFRLLIAYAKTPEGETEASHAEKDGLYKIWDCKKVLFKFNF
jgi:hypothetical protein